MNRRTLLRLLSSVGAIAMLPITAERDDPAILIAVSGKMTNKGPILTAEREGRPDIIRSAAKVTHSMVLKFSRLVGTPVTIAQVDQILSS